MFILWPLSFLAAGLVTLWILLPRLLARIIIPVSKAELSQSHNSDESDSARQVIAQVLSAYDGGARLMLRNSRQRCREKISTMDTNHKLFVLEGSGLGFGILVSAAHQRWRDLGHFAPSESFAMRSAFCRGAGMWAAKRYGMELDQLLFATRRLGVPELNDCIDGYGFKFGLFEFPADRRKIAHLHSLPTPQRRIAFVGLGRAFYLLFHHRRRGLFEAAGDLAPGHDLDVMEGAGYCAGALHCNEPIRAINFARSIPLEWRPHVHLGLTIALRDIQSLDVSQFSKCMTTLSGDCALGVDAAIAMAYQLHDEIFTAHGADGHFLWRDLLASKLQSSGIWEAIHIEAMKASPTSTRQFGAKK